MGNLQAILRRNKERHIESQKQYYVLIQYYMHQENNIFYAFRVSRLDRFIEDCVKNKSVFSRYEYMSYDSLEKQVRLTSTDYYVDVSTRMITQQEARVMSDVFQSDDYEFGVGKLRDIMEEIE